MSCKTETKEINGHEYSVTQWPGQKAMLKKVELTKIFGAALLSMTNDMDLSDAIQHLFTNAEPEDIVKIIRSCVEGVARDGEKMSMSSLDQYFSGDNLIDIYKVFIFVVQTNYGNLLGGQFGDKLAALDK